MKNNYTTKQFAIFLRKVLEDHDRDWRCSPRSGPEEVKDGSLLEEMHSYAQGPWYYFSVHDGPARRQGRSDCGVYVGPKRNFVVACNPFNDDPAFEKRVRACLDGRCV